VAVIVRHEYVFAKTAGLISVVSVAQAEAVVAVEAAGPALASAEPARSCGVPSLRDFAALRGSSPSRPQRSSQVPRTQAKREYQHHYSEDDGVASNDPHKRQHAEGRHDDEQEAEHHREYAVQDQSEEGGPEQTRPRATDRGR
jgi:hypothetical protein